MRCVCAWEGGVEEREKKSNLLRRGKLVGSFVGVTLPKKVCQQGAEKTFQVKAEVGLT